MYTMYGIVCMFTVLKPYQLPIYSTKGYILYTYRVYMHDTYDNAYYHYSII